MYEIKRLDNLKQAEICTEMMSSSEPWITLGRDYQASYQAITDPSKEVYLAFEGQAIAGFILLDVEGVLVGYIQSIYVSPKYRSRGLGTQLIQFAEARLFRQFPNVFILVSSFNLRAKDLYSRLGYKIVGEIPDFIILGESEYIFRKTMGPISHFNPVEFDV